MRQYGGLDINGNETQGNSTVYISEVFGLVLSAANVVSAAVEVGFAADDLIEAQKALQDSKDKELASRAYVIEVFETFTQALTAANRLDEKGLNP